jgi:lipoate-protein ligase B
MMRLQVGAPGRVDYARAVAWQEALVARRTAGAPDALLLLEHPPVYTLGRGADPRHLGGAAGGGVPIHRVHRGGQVTYHGPGQLVGYPIVGLRDLRPDVRWYLRMLERVLIDALADLGIVAGRRGGLTGVWVEDRKIASIGVALRRWVAWHGFALNVGPDLAGFAPIAPCGITGVEMTSVAREGGPAEIGAVLPLVRERFVTTFGYPGWEALTAEGVSGEEAEVASLQVREAEVASLQVREAEVASLQVREAE